MPRDAMKPEERLLLSNQLCFPIYRCARRITRAYAPLLKDLDQIGRAHV